MFPLTSSSTFSHLFFLFLFFGWDVFEISSTTRESPMPSTASSYTSDNDQPQLENPLDEKLGVRDVVFVVLSQSNAYHVHRANTFRSYLKELAMLLGNEKELELLFLHERWPAIGAWTILPTLAGLLADYEGKRKAVFFCEEETRLDLEKLLIRLDEYDFSEVLFLGRGLHDREATIIHHFAFHRNPGEFAFPDFAAGFVVSMPLIKSLVQRMETEDLKQDFSIDVKHELAMFIHDDGKGVALTEVDFLCAGNEDDQCVSYYPSQIPNCGEPIEEGALYVAVKTCKQFHDDRVSIVKKTWGPYAVNMDFYSDIEDPSIPTLTTGIPNVERGHCSKMMEILKRARRDEFISTRDWVIIADDDTLFSIPRLRRLLACYDPREPVALGERYGFRAVGGQGYDYPTGGAGMVLSRTLLEQLIDSEICSCTSDDSPDDMVLGMCLKRLGIPLTNSPLFHQARPSDYAEYLLAHQKPVSFHKHWMVDPLDVYTTYLYDEPRRTKQQKSIPEPQHTEL